MRFNSVVYVLFLLLAGLVTWTLPPRARKAWLLIASYTFYGSWHYPYLALLVGVATLNHVGARWIVAAANRRRRAGFVIAANVILLALFKYLDWMVGSVSTLATWLHLPGLAPPKWVLPLGISFYVFEAISYTVDLARKREKLHPFWDLQLFFAFFPKLIAGPILRAKEFLPQLARRAALTPAAVRTAGWYIVSGLFAKIVIADTLGEQIDRAFARDVGALSSTDVAVMAAGFAIQIYLDFSSYSRIAIGSARLLGIELVENFDSPYVATSPPDFWNRWHMSLSRWVRDYLFYPLVGKQASLVAMCRAAILSMTLCGLWHGPGLTFVTWGLYHGLLIAGYHVLTHRSRKVAPGARPDPPRPRRLPVRLASVAVTFALVTVGWLFFRATTLAHAFGLIGRLIMPWAHRGRSLPGTFYLQTALAVAAVWLAPSVATLIRHLRERADTRGVSVQVAYDVGAGVVVGALVVQAVLFLRGQTSFVYFQF